MTKKMNHAKHILSVVFGVILIGSAYLWIETHQQNTDVQKDNEFVVMNKANIQYLSQTLEALHLNTAQTLKIKTLMLSAQPTFKIYMKESMANIDALEPLWNDNYNAATIATLADQQGQVLSKILQLRIQILTQIYNTLTPDQQAQFSQILGTLLSR